MFFSVICAEDARAATSERIVQSAQGTYLGDVMGRNQKSVCAFWPKGDVPAGYGETVRSDAPVLLLSGELDPVTPPRHAEEALKGLVHGTHLVVPGVGHGTTRHGCVAKLMARFIEDPLAKPPAEECLNSLKQPPFFVGFAGPRP
jgi:pimeloyl-ACP methyl ester carboxylesterase